MIEKRKVEAFILMNRVSLKPEDRPKKQVIYDDNLQIWINQDTGKSIVLQSFENSMKRFCTDFGETTLTRTQEGADQTEVIGASEFGETLMTETREGADQSEMIGFSEFGETRFTATIEGVDQAEIADLSEPKHYV
jgi:hypothetical protein